MTVDDDLTLKVLVTSDTEHIFSLEPREATLMSDLDETREGGVYGPDHLHVVPPGNGPENF